MNDKKRTDFEIDKANEICSDVNQANFDNAIVRLGIQLTNEAMKSSNLDYKFKLVESIVKLRGALPPLYALQNKSKTL